MTFWRVEMALVAAAVAGAAGAAGGWMASDYWRVQPLVLQDAQEDLALETAVSAQRAKVIETERGHQVLADKYVELYRALSRPRPAARPDGVPPQPAEGHPGGLPQATEDPARTDAAPGDGVPAAVIEDCRVVTARLHALQQLLREAGQAD